MIVYTHENGYGNEQEELLREIIQKGVPDPSHRCALRSLLFDYGILLKVVDGKGCSFRHPDGSETRRIKLYETG